MQFCKKRRFLPEFSVRMYQPSSVAMTRERERGRFKGKGDKGKRTRVKGDNRKRERKTGEKGKRERHTR